MQNFQKFIVAEARNNGLSPERLGEAVHVALTTAKPKARYAVVPQRFKNWTLPKLLPVRMLDAAGRKADGTQKAVAKLERRALTARDTRKQRQKHCFVGDRSLPRSRLLFT